MIGGQCDQRFVEMRPDVLCYTTGLLKEDTEVTGYVRATLYAATSAEDTDFIMKLVDVCPDGNCYNVLTGGRRIRVEVCSSDTMNFDINPNAFIDLNKATKAD